MKTLSIAFLFILLSVVCTGQSTPGNKKIAGTWINYRFLNQLRTSSPFEKNTDYIAPRFLYIDSAFFYQYENRFEHISHKTRLVYQKYTDRYLSNNRGFHQQLLLWHDSTLVEVAGDTIINTFIKISTYAVAGSGMQIYLRTLYFSNNKFWKMIHIDNDKIDTQRVIITATKILDRKRKYISEYEFADTYKENVNGEMLFTLSLFDVDKNYMMVNARLFKIKKAGNEVNFYKKEKLEYIFIPDSEQ